MPKFYTEYDRPPSDAEVGSPISKTETAYVPPDIQIDEMIRAGERLGQSRKEMYDFAPGEEDDGYVDPTRSPGFDFADASMLERSARASLRQQKQAAEAEKKSTAAAVDKKAEDGHS